jgi:hypothetical protein
MIILIVVIFCLILNELLHLFIFGVDGFIKKSDYDYIDKKLKYKFVTLYHKNMRIRSKQLVIVKTRSILFPYYLYNYSCNKFKLLFRYNICYKLIKSKFKELR